MAVVIPSVPLPTTRQLVRFIWNGVSSRGTDDDGLRSERMWFFPRGAWGLAAAAGELQSRRRDHNLTVFLPGYFCNQSLTPLRDLGARIVFYPISEALEPEWRETRALAHHVRPDLFILVHYFGFPADAAPALEFCKQYDAVLLEDAAHVLRPGPGIGSSGWATLYSPHKLLPIEELGILVTRDGELQSPLVGFPKKKRSIGRTALWMAKRSIQMGLVAGGMDWRPRAAPFEQDPPSETQCWYGVPLARRWLSLFDEDLDRIAAARRGNYQRLDALVRESIESCRPFFPHLPDEIVPYVLPVMVEEGRVARLHRDLNRLGVPAASWPDLPPEVRRDSRFHRVAVGLRNRMMTLPVHQGLREKDLAHMFDAWRKVMAGAIR